MRRRKLIRDPIHGLIDIDLEFYDGLLLKIIDSPEFNRLKYISQLGLSYFAYPTAQHKRFGHSLGVYYVARSIIDKIPDEYVDRELKDLFLITALIHDIGHAAFSHSMTFLQETIYGKNYVWDHEDWLLEIIRSGNTRISSLLYDSDILSKNDIHTVISFLYDKVGSLGDQGLEKDINPLKLLLSSELDIDRLDYLLRDAYFTGVAYGVYDFNRIYRTIEYDEGLNRIIVIGKGITALEGYLVARYHMYNSIYKHKTTMSAEALLSAIFRRAMDLLEDGKLYHRDFITEELYDFVSMRFKPPIRDYLKIVDHIVLSQIYRWMKHKDNILSELSVRFAYRDLFKPVVLERNRVIPEDNLEKARKYLEREGYNPDYYMLEYRTSIPGYKKYAYDDDPEESKAILVKTDDGEIRDVTDLSMIAKGVSGMTYIHEIYVPEKYRGDIRKLVLV